MKRACYPEFRVARILVRMLPDCPRREKYGEKCSKKKRKIEKENKEERRRIKKKSGRGG